jgi:hypothetical protein
LTYKIEKNGTYTVNGVSMPALIVADTITPSEIDWLWFPYIPYGAASLLFGPGGSGKSHIAVEIAARLSQGDPLPGQENRSKPQKILMLSAEDDFDKVLVPRLMRAGANLSNIAFPEDPFILNPQGVKGLAAYMNSFDASIVFIDPIVHYIGPKVDMNKANEVRGAIGAFHQMAKDKNIAIVIVGHSKKSEEGEDYNKAMGSADFNNAVRSAMYTTRLPDGTRVMKHVKANYAKLGPSQAYDFEGAEGFEWKGEIETGDEWSSPSDGPTQRRSAKRPAIGAELRAMLRVGPMPSRDVEQHFTDLGINARTFQRAKNEAGVESFMVWRAGKPVWYMRLDGDKTTIPSVDDGRNDQVLRPDDTGRLHAVPAGETPADDRPVGGAGQGEPQTGGPVPRGPDARAIAAAFLARTAGANQ